ncbi:hypothetical protein BBK82_38570 [Lentzea guizhouensis]|uniref:Uncharacterized protein n=1 Tax=Lentzea guizhouensis TaxID=1586287 RepID=A0A1B2HTJ2_9PSEU|nr:tetratricopeptide repeat protein [Lentzea guizhouensis]ANZ41012.1 hypothetical protein BBK82_38570 [Lentzea guizhouensis]
MSALRAAIAELSRRGDTPEVRVALAEARFRLALRTDPAEAVELLRAAAEADPFQPKVFLHLGRLLHLQGRYSCALREYRRAAELVPDSDRVRRLVALAEHGLGPAKKRVKPTADTWLLLLLDELAKPKPARAQVTACLEHATGTERAVAAILLLATGEHPAKVRDLADDPVLDAVLELAEERDPAAFVGTAAEHLRAGTLPIELVCCTHFAKYRHLPALDALRLLDRYPADLRDQDCFTELEIAVLDACARRAWAEDRLDEAKLLWRETIPLDPHRVPVAVNLALLAARTRSAEEYGPAWARLAELLYLHAAAAGNVQLMLEDRVTLHRAISQNSRQRHVLGRDLPDEEQLRSWLRDPEALEVWLREWDCHYLNARLGFRSPTYRLGVRTTAARDALVRHVDAELRPRRWTGIGVFCDLANASFAEARAQRHDDYLELEKARADALTDETFHHALLLRRLLHALTDTPNPLRQGLLLARHLFALPWPDFQPLCVERGLVDPGVDLDQLFEADLIRLAAGENRLEDLDACIELLPHRLAPRAFRCRALQQAGRLDEAYAEALEALKEPVVDEDLPRRAGLVGLLGAIGREAVPAHLSEFGDRAGLEAFVDAARVALDRFPHAGSLRVHLARTLTALGGAERMTEAERLLAEGVAIALTDEQRQEFEQALTSTGEAAEVDTARRRVLELFNAALDGARDAVDEYNEARYAGMAHRSLAKIRRALDDLAEALTVAEQAGLRREVAELEKWLDHLGELEGELQRRGVW